MTMPYGREYSESDDWVDEDGVLHRGVGNTEGAEHIRPLGVVPETDSEDAEYARPRVWKATELDGARSIDWLARRRLPAGAVTYMLGPEGIGKSLFLMWLAAVITTGKPCPEFGIPARDPAVVVLVLTEDDWATVVRPRLEVVGADLDMVRVICTDRDGSGSPIFPHHMDVVAEAAEEASIVMVDAWADTLPGSLSVKDPQQARKALHPWKELATRSGAAMLLSGHTNREKGGNVRNAYGLSGEIRKKARMTILAQADQEEGVLVIGPEKSNLTASVAASRFRIEAVQVFAPTDASDGTVPRLVWIGDSEQSAGEFFAEAAEIAEDADGESRSSARAWLEDYLTEQGKVLARVAKAEGKKAGFSERTIQRTAKSLKVVYVSEGFPRETYWSLPQSRQG